MADTIVLKDGHMAITGYHGYAVSCDGRVWSYRCRNGRGYKSEPHLMAGGMRKQVPSVALGITKDFHPIDTLVANAFIGERPSDAHVLEHRDGNAFNSATSNLFWRDTTPAFEIRPVPGCDGFYAAADGSIWNRAVASQSRFPGHWKQVKPSLREHGYCGINVGGEVQYVHVMVLRAFVGDCPPGMEACHFPDRTRTNNAISNLRWDTHKQNAEDARKHGTLVVGEDCWFAKLTESEVVTIREIAAHTSYEAIATRFGVHPNHVASIVRRRFWKHVA